MNSPAVDIAGVLDYYSVAEHATDLFVGFEPESPDSCVTVLDTGGESPEATASPVEYPTVMVRVRGKRGTYQTTYALAREVQEALHKLADYDISSTDRIIAVFQNGDINYLGPDENQRPVFSLNFRILRTGS